MKMLSVKIQELYFYIIIITKLSFVSETAGISGPQVQRESNIRESISFIESDSKV